MGNGGGNPGGWKSRWEAGSLSIEGSLALMSVPQSRHPICLGNNCAVLKVPQPASSMKPAPQERLEFLPTPRSNTPHTAAVDPWPTPREAAQVIPATHRNRTSARTTRSFRHPRSQGDRWSDDRQNRADQGDAECAMQWDVEEMQQASEDGLATSLIRGGQTVADERRDFGNSE